MVNFKRSSEGSIQENRIPTVGGDGYSDPWGGFGHESSGAPHSGPVIRYGVYSEPEDTFKAWRTRNYLMNKYGSTRLTGGARGNL